MLYNYALILIFFLSAADFVIPQQSRLSKNVNYISEYISSEQFEELSKRTPQLALVDSIYIAALKFNNYNVSETLLGLTFGTIPYNIVPIKLPVIGIVIQYPLVSASDSVYKKKNKNLPRYLFKDTPKDDFGDKDKLAHFFGNAFLSYSQSIFDLTDLIGYFVEYFEDSFKVQTAADPRDIKANYLGKIFGQRLKNDKQALPSEILINKSLQ